MNSNNSANKRIKFMNVKIEKAEREDLNEILELQYLAYQSEAALFGTNDIPPLRQTLD